MDAVHTWLETLNTFFETVAPLEHLLVWVTGLAALWLILRLPEQREAFRLHIRRLTRTETHTDKNGDKDTTVLEYESIDDDK